MEKVESFALDHTAVRAPYVRRITVERGPRGDAISNFDIRLVQPNAGEIPTAGLHTIEHLLAGLLREQLTGVIDCSPFGCRTGFHLLVWGEPDAATVAAAVKNALTVIADRITWNDVPATDAISCGNYRDHSLHSAKTWASDVLAQGISSDAFARELV